MLLFSKYRDYLLLLAAAFCWGSSLSQLTMLAVVLRDHGMSAPMIATVLSASTVAMLLASLASGPLASRLGATRTLLIGAIVSLTAIAVLPFAVGAAPLATLAMAGRGLGAGLFTPSGQLFAQAQARADDRTRAVGMFTAMFLIPNFFGPALGEWSLRHLGEIGFLLLPILPMVAALLLVCWLRRDDTAARRTMRVIWHYCATISNGCRTWRRCNRVSPMPSPRAFCPCCWSNATSRSPRFSARSRSCCW
jgi:MFS family permease